MLGKSIGACTFGSNGMNHLKRATTALFAPYDKDEAFGERYDFATRQSASLNKRNSIELLKVGRGRPEIFVPGKPCDRNFSAVL